MNFTGVDILGPQDNSSTLDETTYIFSHIYQHTHTHTYIYIYIYIGTHVHTHIAEGGGGRRGYVYSCFLLHLNLGPAIIDVF